MTPSARHHIFDLPDETLDAIFRAVCGWQRGHDDQVRFWESPDRSDTRVG